MDTSAAIDLAREAAWLTFLLSTPLLGASLVVGLVMSIGQAVTQIQDQTVSFVPKLFVELLVMLLLLPWMLSQMTEYAINLFRDIPGSL
jgi:flagellar biosynthetic protein FliQ